MSGSGLDLIAPEDLDAQRTLLEAVGDAFGTEDDVLKALLANQVLLGQAVGEAPGGLSPRIIRELEDLQDEVNELQQNQDQNNLAIINRLDQIIAQLGGTPPPSPDRDTMPVGSLGVALDGLDHDDTGPAMFFPSGGRTQIEVQADGDVDTFDIVVVDRISDSTSVVEEAEKGQAMFNGVVVDTDSTDPTASLDAGDSVTLEVDTIGADEIVLLVDDGNLGARPAEYGLTQHIFVAEQGEYQFYDQRQSRSRSVVDGAIPPRMRCIIRNQSGSDDQDYRITLLAIRRSG